MILLISSQKYHYYSLTLSLSSFTFDSLSEAFFLFVFAISRKKTLAPIDKNEFAQKTIMGMGYGTSATIGAPMVTQCATKLTTPKTVATYCVGKSLATET